MDICSGQLLSSMCFAGLYHALRRCGVPPKITCNGVCGVFALSVIHVAGTAVLLGDHARHAHFVWLTGGYFLFDILYIVCCVKKTLFHYALIYHHLVAIMIANVDPTQYSGPLIILVGELSNLISFPVYHGIQIKDTLTPTNQAWLMRLKAMQKVWYGFWRVGVFSGLAVKFYVCAPPGDYGMGPVHAVSLVYMRGLVWTVSLGRQKGSV